MAGRYKDNYQYKASSSYDVEQRAGETELQYYRRLAKVADQRLVRLESYKHDKYFGGVEKMAYGRAMSDLEMFGGGTALIRNLRRTGECFGRRYEHESLFAVPSDSTKQGNH